MWLLYLSLAAHAGPWIHEPGHGYLKLGTVRFAAEDTVDASGQLSEGRPTVFNNHQLYAEVGLLKGLQTVIQLPFISARSTLAETPYINRALGDAQLGLAAGGRLGRVPASLQLSAKLPLYDNATLQEYGIYAERFPIPGDGQVDLTLEAALGGGLTVGSQAGWTSAGLGYRHRTEWWMGDSSRPDRTYSDGLVWQAQLGWLPRLGEHELGWWSLDASGLHSLAPNPSTREQLQIGSGLGLWLGQGFALETGGALVPWARASARGWSTWLGLSHKR